MSDWLCITGSDDRHLETIVYGPFVSEEQAWEVAQELSTDPEGDVEVKQLCQDYAWLITHKRGHTAIGGPPNPNCPFCQRENT